MVMTYTRADLDHGSKIPNWYSFQNPYELSILSDPQVTWKCIPNPPLAILQAVWQEVPSLYDCPAGVGGWGCQRG